MGAEQISGVSPTPGHPLWSRPSGPTPATTFARTDLETGKLLGAEAQRLVEMYASVHHDRLAGTPEVESLLLVV